MLLFVMVRWTSISAPGGSMGPEICTEQLMEDAFVCAGRANHSILMEKVTLQAYANGNHVVASRRGRAYGR
ncbi:hypothetical protein AXG89_29690 (plasmid) [Burkholderia sp. PAMC 26561]|nr:hypothetical protein AXG89_29690 [Burkholderia sp. PAMC 26561]